MYSRPLHRSLTLPEAASYGLVYEDRFNPLNNKTDGEVTPEYPTAFDEQIPYHIYQITQGEILSNYIISE